MLLLILHVHATQKGDTHMRRSIAKQKIVLVHWHTCQSTLSLCARNRAASSTSQRARERERCTCASSASSPLYERPPTLRTLVVRHFLHEAIGVSHNSFSDGVDPILLLLLGVCDEVHRITLCRELECIRFVDDIFCALHREALIDRDASSRLGRPCDRSFFEPEDLAVFQHEPSLAPRLDELPYQPINQPATLGISNCISSKCSK